MEMVFTNKNKRDPLVLVPTLNGPIVNTYLGGLQLHLESYFFTVAWTRLRSYSHQAKSGAKAKKIKEQV